MSNNDLIESLLPAVEQQLDSPDTPYVRSTFNRLVDQESIDPGEAKEMIAFCLADESNRMFIDKRDFDTVRYQELLDNLHQLFQKPGAYYPIPVEKSFDLDVT